MRKLTRLVRQNLSWQGRAPRTTLYLSIGLVYLAGFLTIPLLLLQLAVPSPPLVWLVSLILFALGAMVAVFFLGALVRRLHDRDRSGWWLLVFFGPHMALASGLSQIPATEQQLMTIVLIVGIFLVAPFLVWGMVEVFLLRGVKGANRYGPDPLRLADSPQPTPAP
ncbi:uncharacterized membrane protein YhaH (DUF805 family) [Caulobacter ginsengisoli]|uniref:Uncharacterized membrane protein YhaH (DUF805 family) n=1 Tax=Caulobacter ginsengisoli TaxID=400775 RepID=A0ABU0IWI9_9CAUL|nr:DUF805 domain-containing protein [Caulobacter ginsengisoli]MDQ0466355.1 uncharacterized membrane protein YhaH (DUF805 family) [Caulobacter ginsengisoli]